MEGLRHQGKPRREWIHDIEEWTGCEYIQLKEMSQDRAQWRRKISEWSSAVANPHRGRSTSEWVCDPLLNFGGQNNTFYGTYFFGSGPSAGRPCAETGQLFEILKQTCPEGMLWLSSPQVWWSSVQAQPNRRNFPSFCHLFVTLTRWLYIQIIPGQYLWCSHFTMPLPEFTQFI